MTRAGATRTLIPGNVSPGTLFVGDNLDMLRGINTGIIDLIYLDPPFHSDQTFAAPLDSAAAGQVLRDVFHPSEVKEEWIEGIRDYAPAVYAVCEAARAAVGAERWAYLVFMAPRLMEIHRVLAPHGSCWLHCDWRADGWLRTLMDAIFGGRNMLGSIAWCYAGPGNVKDWFPRKHDTLLWFVKGDVGAHGDILPRAKRGWTFEAPRVPYTRMSGTGATSLAAGGRTKEERQEAEAAARERGKRVEDYWTDIGAGTHAPEIARGKGSGWTTQKPVKLLERIILSCSRGREEDREGNVLYEGDLVLDPFCGCATAMVAAQKHRRRWIGIDLAAQAQGVTLKRMIGEAGLLAAPQAIRVETDPPTRTDGGETAAEALQHEFERAREAAAILSAGQKERLRRELYERLEGRCGGYRLEDGRSRRCVAGGFLALDFFELDHVRPRVRGGKDRADNLQLIRIPCHKAKTQENRDRRSGEKGKQ